MILDTRVCDFLLRAGFLGVEWYCSGCRMAARVEKLIGLLLVVLAGLWAAYHLVSTREFHPGFFRLGPMQLLMAGLLVWLHGKYRAAHFTRVRRDYQTRFHDL